MSKADIIYPTGICVLYLLILCITYPLMQPLMNINWEYGPYDLIYITLTMAAIQMVYNNILLIAHITLGIKMMISIYQNNYNILCQPVYFNDSDSIRILMYIYYILKLFQLGEIFFYFSMTKNWLMLFHKISMVFLAWYAVKYIPGGSVLVWAMLDCLVYIAIFAYGFAYDNTYWTWTERTDEPEKLAVYTALLSLFLIFYNCVVILAMDCGFPHKVAETVIIYIMVLLLLKILEPYYNKPTRNIGSNWFYYFFTPMILAPILQLLIFTVIEMITRFFKGRRR